MKTKVHYMVLDIAMGTFNAVNEGLQYIDSLRKNIKKICIQNASNCLFYIAMSISNQDEIRRTRYGSKLISGATEQTPHIHCIGLVEKQSFISRKIVDYLKTTKAIKMFKEHHPRKKAIFVESIHAPDELRTRLIYRVSQAYKFRIVNTCTDEFAKKYIGTFVSLIEEKENAMRGSKPVFSKYANMALCADESVFDFSSNIPNNVLEKDEVWNGEYERLHNKNIAQHSSVCLKNYESTPFLSTNDKNHAIFSTLFINPASIGTTNLDGKEAHCKDIYINHTSNINIFT